MRWFQPLAHCHRARTEVLIRASALYYKLRLNYKLRLTCCCTYGPRLTESYRRLADYVDRILRGAKPTDLPIERPTKFKMVINQRTAKTLGLTIPPALLVTADEVIE